MNEEQFKTWAIVELMGHSEYAGYVQQEVIAGFNMLRIDVPQTETYGAFTKYVSPASLYGISPCTEETARARAEQNQSTPFSSWSVENQIMEKLKTSGRLLPEPSPEFEYDEDTPF